MTLPTPASNPYASPVEVDVPGARSFFGATFEVGDEERHTVSASINTWTGREVYAVDGQTKLVTRKRWGTRRIVVGERERHEVAFRVSMFCWVRVYVDGELFEDDLFPSARRALQAAGGVMLLAGLVAALAHLIPELL